MPQTGTRRRTQSRPRRTSRTRTRRSPRNPKKRHPIRNILILLLLIAVVAVSLYFAVGNLGKAKNRLEEAAYPIKYSGIIDKAADKYNLEKPLIYAVIHTESRFDPDAVSHVGAQGLMQIMPETFDWIASLKDETVSSSEYTDPSLNVDYGCYLLKYLIKRFKAEETAVAAYNAGFNKVDQWLDDPNLSPDGKKLASIPYPETEKYVKKVESAKKMYTKLYFQ